MGITAIGTILARARRLIRNSELPLGMGTWEVGSQAIRLQVCAGPSENPEDMDAEDARVEGSVLSKRPCSLGSLVLSE